MMDIVPLFKALADESRIKILGLLLDRRLAVEEIAAAVQLSPATVSHHLGRLRDAGLVESRQEGLYTIHTFRRQPLLDALRAVADPSAAPELAEDLARYDQKVLSDFLVNGQLKAIPAQRKKREVILRFLADRFEPGRRYPEKEVNLLLAGYHEDFATLRRELVDAHLLQREAGIYQRTATDANPT